MQNFCWPFGAFPGGKLTPFWAKNGFLPNFTKILGLFWNLKFMLNLCLCSGKVYNILQYTIYYNIWILKYWSNTVFLSLKNTISENFSNIKPCLRDQGRNPPPPQKKGPFDGCWISMKKFETLYLGNHKCYTNEN